MHEFSTNREMQTYRYGAVETAFLKRDQNEDQALGIYVKAMRFWKLISLISLSVSFLLLLILIGEVFTPKVHVLYADMLSNGFVKSICWLPETKSAT